MKRKIVTVILSMALSLTLVMPVCAEEVSISETEVDVTEEESEEIVKETDGDTSSSDMGIETEGIMFESLPEDESLNGENLVESEEVTDELTGGLAPRPTSGTCGENVTFNLNTEDGILTISGTGKMYKYSNIYGDESPLYGNINIKKVIIEDGITSIGAGMFISCTNLSEVSIPQSVTEIQTDAFYRCESLESITIPDSVTYIGNYAFGSSGIKSITIPGSVTYLGNDPFYYCSDLREAYISDSVTDTPTGSMYFNFNNKLTHVTTPYDGAFLLYGKWMNDSTGEIIKDGEVKKGSYSRVTTLEFRDLVDFEPQTIVYGKPYGTYAEFPTPTKSGYTFDGWYLLPEDKEKVTSDTIVTYICTGAEEKQVLKAHWVKDSENTSSFNDVPTNKYYSSAVSWAVSKNITSGTGNGQFSPEKACTRGQVVTFLWRAYNCPEPSSTESKFADVQDSSKYYYKAILWAVEKGITTGTSDTTFSPDATVTRGQFVTFIYRAEGQPEVTATSNFTDVQDSSKYYYKPVIWAVSKGITNGTSDTTFSPDDPCTRGQVVTFLFREMK